MARLQKLRRRFNPRTTVSGQRYGFHCQGKDFMIGDVPAIPSQEKLGAGNRCDSDVERIGLVLRGYCMDGNQPVCKTLRFGRDRQNFQVGDDFLSRCDLQGVPFSCFINDDVGDAKKIFSGFLLPPTARSRLIESKFRIGRDARGQVADEARFKVDERLGRGGWHGGNRVDAADDTRGPAERQPLFSEIARTTRSNAGPSRASHDGMRAAAEPLRASLAEP